MARFAKVMFSTLLLVGGLAASGESLADDGPFSYAQIDAMVSAGDQIALTVTLDPENTVLSLLITNITTLQEGEPEYLPIDPSDRNSALTPEILFEDLEDGSVAVTIAYDSGDSFMFDSAQGQIKTIFP